MKATLFFRLENALGALLRVFSIACVAALTLLLTLNIFSRATGWFGMNWFDEVVVTIFAWLVFIGASALWRDRDHFAISLLSDALKGKRLEGLHKVVIALLGLLFAVVLMVYGARFVDRTTATTPVLELPQAWAYACMPIAGFLMTLYALRDVWSALREMFTPAGEATDPPAAAPAPKETI
ncbi:TRAP transporter small permease [Variovorax guangxiensis]|uniref:TRAP transporter small permease n=1 Tax=Variovorax guangxiensis TaxID=1775474 RepID=UPI001386E59F|nr:TRAP transporter small permease [Variovorax guangxiensis]